MSKSPFSRLNPSSTDRNDRARMDVARQQFAGRVARGELGPVDLLGQKVSKGSLVVWKAPQEIIWEVTDVAPALDPNAPPGAVRVELQAASSFVALANNVLPILIKVAQKADPPETEGERAETDIPEGERPDADPVQ